MIWDSGAAGLMQYASDMAVPVSTKWTVVALGLVLVLVVSACASSDPDPQLAGPAPAPAEPTPPTDSLIVGDLDAAYAEFSTVLGSFGGASLSRAQADLLAEVDCGRIASASSAANFSERWDLANAQRIADGLDEELLKTISLVAVSAYCPSWNVAVSAAFNPQLILRDVTAEEFGVGLRAAVDAGEMPERSGELVVDAFVESGLYTPEQETALTDAFDAE